MVQIVPDIFRSAFAGAVRGTIAESAEVEIEIVPIKMKCMDCGCIFEVKNNFFLCGVCKSSDLDIVEGKEMFVKSIEGE
jgi:hydrogenase nickel incorporation protein HypA/HybF